eukprot:CAMPEP_0201573432 /NCGR_PEP_ID=MMETSP0190_2-20130828/17301_1 /ASSEMBLY_ACC=CAM_ASM_000263 /TAXON_ID=37353 /ORGANISM="Rosalina sp." /LENGTH=85 /DNA_ID=CAMNT_0048000419 /DNA_START=384 /DNA_END=641 /DNA_ORIENTATION=+
MDVSDIRMFYDHFMNKSMNTKQCLILSMNNETPPLNQDSKLKKLKCINCKYENNNNLSSETIQQVLEWIGIVFGYHDYAEFGVFD